ncbi:hypothetical protein OHB24_40175 [Kribbella sp. NBC_00482]|uniref:hypothetical protein n=1 Tax=Kribbella sp. NBC_00482 TaxID=2975968 RepID=UPI002E19510B
MSLPTGRESEQDPQRDGETQVVDGGSCRTVRSTYIAPAVAVCAVGAGALWAWNVATIYDSRPAEAKISSAAGSDFLVMQILPICCGVIGVLAMTSEHATRSITTTLIAVPGRLRILLGKALTVGSVAPPRQS